MKNELTAMQLIDHPNTPNFFGTFMSTGDCYMIIEYIPGMLLNEVFTPMDYS